MDSRPIPFFAACLAATLLLTATATAQLSIHHSPPLAGTTLTLVVEGAEPGGQIWLELYEPSEAPPSLVGHLMTQSEAFEPTEQALLTFWVADERGRMVVSVPLVQLEDGDRAVHLIAHSGGVSSELLNIHVQPPMVLVPATTGLERIDLRLGDRLDPAIAGAEDMLGVALSATGDVAYVLRAGGLVDERSAARWSAPRHRTISVDTASDEIATSRDGGAAFVLARPTGEPFTPAGHLMFLDGESEPVMLAPMGEAVPGRRWALTDDGLTAFVAEDDLLVSEIDVPGRRLLATFPVGLVGDGAIVDMALVDRRLFVATSRAPNRAGSTAGALTILDLDAGALEIHTLDIAPLRLLPLGGDRLLVVPAEGAYVQSVVDGVVQPMLGPPPAGDGVWLDAAVSDRGVVLLRRSADGSHALDLLRTDGSLTTFLDPVPEATRVAAAGFGVAILLGHPEGRVHRVDLATGQLDVIPGVLAHPEAPFVVLD